MEPDVALEAAPLKPQFRGVFHQYAAPAAAGAGAVLTAIAPPGRATYAAAVFALSLVTLFSISASYHRIHLTPGPRLWMRRADHAAIFVLIAGTYTPIAAVGLGGAAGLKLLVAIWIGALLGILKSLFWPKSPKPVTAILAVVVGWTLLPYIGEIRSTCGTTTFALLGIGGLAYSLGAVAYATKRPALNPAFFGYHEVFHALTLVGAATHFWAVFRILRGLR
jgi:hemolysin III